MSTLSLGDCSSATAYALGALAAAERHAFEAHLAGCKACKDEIARHAATLVALSSPTAPTAHVPQLRSQLLDLAEAPRLPLDPSAYAWNEVEPGLKIAEIKSDPSRGFRACLVWGRPGATHPAHDHVGDEIIFVMQGALRDFRGTYTAGDICHARPGIVHSEEIVGDDDCFCYALYYQPI